MASETMEYVTWRDGARRDEFELVHAFECMQKVDRIRGILETTPDDDEKIFRIKEEVAE